MHTWVINQTKSHREDANIYTWLLKPTPNPSKIRPKISIKIFSAPPLMAPPARNKQPPSNMMFLRPKVAVRRLAIRDEANPAMYNDDVNAVNVWLLYRQYKLVLASANFTSIVGKNFLRNGIIVVTPPVINRVHAWKNLLVSIKNRLWYYSTTQHEFFILLPLLDPSLLLYIKLNSSYLVEMGVKLI